MTDALGAARLLDWDTRFFGFPVAAIDDAALPDLLLEGTLGACRRAGVALVFWGAEAGRVAPAEVMREHGGAVVDRRLTYAAELPLPASRGGADGITIEELPAGPAGPDLLALGIAAGEHSRFRVDPRIPAGRFEALYAQWMDRSCRHELADAVLVARGSGGATAGMVTVALEGTAGKIGLVAVDRAFRGRGIGRTLLGRAHALMEGRSARRTSVVTQGANLPASSLYERAGYRVDLERNFHHFWLA